MAHLAITSPCKNCEGRHFKCHVTCETYVKWKTEREIEREKLLRFNEINLPPRYIGYDRLDIIRKEHGMKKLGAILMSILLITSGFTSNASPGVIYISDTEAKEYDSLELLADICMAEAEGEPEEGQRLVIDTILNRVDSDAFPDTVYDVIYQKNQFSCTTNGRAARVEPTDRIRELVNEEIENRTNYDVRYFRAGHYGYGSPLFVVGHHYFSK